MVEFVDLVALRPIRRKDGTKAVRMADGTLLEIVPIKFVCGDLGNGKGVGEGHPSMGDVTVGRGFHKAN